MSRASLHRHFLAITGFVPSQYQKHLSLQEARQLLLAGGHSASQFTIGMQALCPVARSNSVTVETTALPSGESGHISRHR
ncbi:AraC family transcriptional regulator [Agrobacterium tumefaciens]|nr:AraC family transcriptional regulator [Agrobacterium tumefaciens]